MLLVLVYRWRNWGSKRWNHQFKIQSWPSLFTSFTFWALFTSSYLPQMSFFFCLLLEFQNLGSEKTPVGCILKKQWHTSLQLFPRPFICFLRDSDRILLFNPYTRICISKPSLRYWLIFDERRNPSWWDYELQGERNVSDGFPGILEITPPQLQPT